MQLLVRLPVRPERAHIITVGEFAIINLGVTLQTYMLLYGTATLPDENRFVARGN